MQDAVLIFTLVTWVRRFRFVYICCQILKICSGCLGCKVGDSHDNRV